MSRQIRTVAWASIGVAILAAGVGGMAKHRRMAHTTHPKTGNVLTVPGDEARATLLFNGWRISPTGRPLEIGDVPLGGAFSPDGKLFAICNAGFNEHQIHFIDPATERETATLTLNRAGMGIAWQADGNRLYVSGGINNALNDVHVIERGKTGQPVQAHGFLLPGVARDMAHIAGLALSPDGNALYILNNRDDTCYVLDAHSGALRSKFVTGKRPLACRLSGDGKTLYVTNMMGPTVAIVDVSDAEHPNVTAQLPCGEHPNDLALSGDGRLYVTCGNSDEVDVFDAITRTRLETVKTALTPSAPQGCTPNAVAVTPDGKTVYVANADNNSVCAIDTSERGHSRVRGFVPTGWYPTAVAVTPDGKRVIIGSGKGPGTRPNPAKSPINPVAPGGFEYIGRQLEGRLAFVDAPNDAQLGDYTRQVVANTPYKDAQLTGVENSRHTAIPNHVGEASPIQHVLYIIKENRTYDQVFGDIKKGNGDPNLCLFGETVTPNHHALARQYVLLDNLYCNGEVSADGHPWSDAAIVTDYTQRSWMLSYADRGEGYFDDGIGDAKAGYIWDACNRKGLTYRAYGEFVFASSAKNPPEKFIGATGLVGHVSQRYEEIPKSKASPYGRDGDHADVFISEFKEFEKAGTVPRFMVMSLGEDHTSGTTPGRYTPKASVASNDQALGRIVDAISHSSLWSKFAIFVIEDDAQNGPDHVDAHRTAGLVISPYTRRGIVDSTMYSTCSYLHTMELILGLGPMSQYDAAATPLFASFTDKPNLAPYTALSPHIDITATNPTSAYGAQASAKLDWSAYDRADEQVLNRVLWHSIKGRNVPMPPPVRRALVAANGRVAAYPAHRDNDD